jgi:hypothetical protein
MVVGQPTPGAGMVGATGVNGVTGPKREYGIKGSFDRDELDKRLADTRARVDAMLTNTSTKTLEERLKVGRESTKGRLEDLNEMYASPMALEAERDALNPRFDPYDAGRRSRQMSDYESMLQENRNAYDKRTDSLSNPERPSLSSLGARYGATAKFGHKPYEQAKAAGYSDSEILSYLKENPATRGNDLYQELLSGNVNFNNITSHADRGPQGFQNIINSIM